MNLANVMDQVAAQLEGVTGLNVFAFPPDSLTPPAAVVSYPETYTFDETYGRGSDKLNLPLVVVVGKVTDRGTRKELAAYCDGSGPKSVKALVESGGYTAFHSIRVTGIDFDAITIGGTDYMAALFTLDITGSGS